MTWAGWTFDFHDPMLLAFVMVPIGQDLHLSLGELSLVFGVTLL